MKNIINTFWSVLGLAFLFLCYRLLGMVSFAFEKPLEGLTERIKMYCRRANRTGLSEKKIKLIIVGAILFVSIIAFLVSGTSLSGIKESLFPYLIEDGRHSEQWRTDPFMTSLVLSAPGLLIVAVYKLICWTVDMITGANNEHISRRDVLLCDVLVFLAVTIMECAVGDKLLFSFKAFLNLFNNAGFLKTVICGLILIPVLYAMLDALFSNGFLITQCVFTLCACSHTSASSILSFMLIVFIGLIANIVLNNARSKEVDNLEKTESTYKYSAGILIAEWILFTIILRCLS